MDSDPPSVRLGERYEIQTGVPLGAFGASEAPSYRAHDRAHPGVPFVALVTEPGMPPRLALIEAMAGLHTDRLVKPFAFGVVDWPPRGRRVFALVFDEPGKRLVTDLGAPFAPFAAEAVLDEILPPVLAALRALAEIGATHRALRPTNVFRAENGRIVLGECVSGPPAAQQPVLFETVESALAHPMGRGAGTQADDIYALGMTIATLVLGRDPMAGMSADEIIAAKIARGSLAAMVGAAGATPRLVDLIRGLVADDPRERWTLADLDGWVQQRRVPVHQAPVPKRAARPLEFEGEKYVAARPLARHFVREGSAAAKLIRSGELDVWLQRSLNAAECAAAVARAVAEAGEPGSAAHESQLVARVAMALDPAAPLRHLDLAAAVDGLGPVLAATMRAGGAAAAIGDAVMARLPHFWFSVQGVLRPDQVMLLKSFDRVRIQLEDRRPGFGLARILYELNPGLHCFSPAVESAHAIDGAGLMPALERAAASGGLAEPLIDRHLAAFIAARCRGAGSDWLDELANVKPDARALGQLRVLAYLQGQAGGKPAPRLAARVERDLPPVIARFRSRTRRTALGASLARFAEHGDLAAMLAALTDPAERQRDEAGFRAARTEQNAIAAERAALAASAAERETHAAELGGTISFALASALSAASVLGALIVGV